MRPVSARFLDAVRSSHQIASRVEILSSGTVVATFPAVGGNVALDANAAIRGSADVTFVDDGTLGIVPTDATDPLAPYGQEIRVSRGVRYPDGSEELVALGVFGIQDVDVSDTNEGVEIQVTGRDRAQKVIDARFEEPYQVAAGIDHNTALQAVIDAGVPGLTYDLADVAATTGQLLAAEQDDRWAFAQEMAKTRGYLLYFDGAGQVVTEIIAAPTGTSQADIIEGEGGVLLTAGRRWTRDGTFNRVIATGENTGVGTPVRGVATDDNPLSPTYYFGPFGKVPRFYTSSFITTAAQALDAAQGILNKELGTSQTVTFGAVVNPALEPNDIVKITRQRAGIDENHVIDSLTVPLSATESMTGQTRAVQVTS